jgi:hypothetical protein
MLDNWHALTSLPASGVVQTDIVESASPDLWPMTLRPPDDKIGTEPIALDAR